ncbi:hypothetical protein FRACYDRAFT_205645 [Fragilariopsis cylindrus CCMP1102]|uniref:Uncharacterized protein n=1 Tax=Fragilariopsis cylindrus CCMP1102 TaxID=635003 RepID=A0A1E7FZA8_9STRA|nr:hypothetical protein FRACYDRAFT_205645 [Fragilariopsis cylindrus CCMP1102]|eukprot:OEU23475.1 hypothetical protein FRACYDRAFT_205645 [Fragilariopsis cylindrus CCMP1102]
MSKNIRFASPLQSLTIPDPELFAENEKDKNTFLPKFLTGLTAENQIREEIAVGTVKISDSNDDDDSFDVSGKDWVGNTKTAEAKRKRREDQVVEEAYDKAIASFEQQQEQRLSSKKMKKKKTNSNKYQYVGVVGINNKDKKNEKKKKNNPISWYARPKPKHSNWSVRLLHVNKDVIIKDLFDQGKIDIFAKYTNTGPQQPKQSLQAPVVTTKYEARERSWKTLWNFSPKHFLTDSSGAYWRERRLRDGMYTDGDNVYESSYRYRDGRNGMNRVSTFQQFLSSKSVNAKDKQRILKKLQSAAPDIVLEM